MDSISLWDGGELYHQRNQASGENVQAEATVNIKKCTSLISIHNHTMRPTPCLNRCGEVLESSKAHEDHLTNDCPLTVIDCEFKHVGCDVRVERRDMPLHLGQGVILHLSKQTEAYKTRLKMLETDNKRLSTKCFRLESELKELEQKFNQLLFMVAQPNDSSLSSLKVHDKDSKITTCSHRPVDCSYVYAVKPQNPLAYKGSKAKDLTVITTKLTMTNFEKHKINNNHWVSQPFFTHPQGYMMCLRVTANGQGSGKGTHITMEVYLMKGEFDDHLEWPFRGDITIQLLNQEGGNDHYTKTIYEAKCTKDEQMTGAKNFIKAWAINQFKAHRELCSKYLKNDTLNFRIFTLVKHEEGSFLQMPETYV